MDAIDKAFSSVDRAGFIPADIRDKAGLDVALPIGFGQTISQPSTVEMMLRWLEPEPGDKVLDVGSGSGWTTALLARLVGPNGYVQAVEIVPELVEFGRSNCTSAGISNARFHKAGKTLGWPKAAPYDRILVSAAARSLPHELLEQLADGGKMVVPIGNDILEIEKSGEEASINIHPGFVFVPLIH